MALVRTEAARVNIIDANGLGGDVTVEADMCVIGSGACGHDRRDGARWSRRAVCLIESGYFGPDEETQALYT